VTIVVDREVPLNEVVELHVKVQGVGLMVAKELVLNGKPDLTSGATMLMDGRLKVNGE
jgi:hypothetical protein